MGVLCADDQLQWAMSGPETRLGLQVVAASPSALGLHPAAGGQPRRSPGRSAWGATIAHRAGALRFAVAALAVVVRMLSTAEVVGGAAKASLARPDQGARATGGSACSGTSTRRREIRRGMGIGWRHPGCMAVG